LLDGCRDVGLASASPGAAVPLPWAGKAAGSYRQT
jgi:hypothetical protein